MNKNQGDDKEIDKHGYCTCLSKAHHYVAMPVSVLKGHLALKYFLAD